MRDEKTLWERQLSTSRRGSRNIRWRFSGGTFVKEIQSVVREDGSATGWFHEVPITRAFPHDVIRDGREMNHAST